MLDLVALILAVVALVTIRRLKRRVDELQRQISRQGLQAPGNWTSEADAGFRDAWTPTPGSSTTPGPEVTSSEILPPAPPESGVSGAAEVDDAGRGSVPPMPPADEVPRGASPPMPPTPSLEERLGTRWAVWVGGLALALGGLLLVRYSIEQGWFGPAARIIAGLFFAGALIAAGEWFRRGERNFGVEIVPVAHIPGVLSAAGTATLFGTVYAAHALYEFIGTGVTFVLLGLIGIGTMLAAALHGPALAGLGLVGSYVAPMLVASVRPNPWSLVVYLGIVAASASGLARLRHWLWLAASAIGGAFLWGLVLADRAAWGVGDWSSAATAHVMLQMLLAAGFLAIEPHLGTRDEDARTDFVATAAMGTLTLLASILLVVGPRDLGTLLPLTLGATALLLLVAWRSAPVVWAAVMAGLVVLTSLARWPGLRLAPPSSLMVPELEPVLRLPEHVESFILFAVGACVAVAMASGARIWNGRRLEAIVAGPYLLAATVTPLLALILAWLRVKQFDTSLSFALGGLVLGSAFAVAADRFQKAEEEGSATMQLAVGAFAAAAIAALAFAFVASLERGYLTVALALTALGAAWVADLRSIPLLRHVVTAMAFVVLARIAWDPRIAGADVGRIPVLNWLLLGYGVSSAAFYGAARVMQRRGADFSMHVSDAVAVLLAGLLAFFQIRHALNGGDPFAPATGHVEIGLFALVSLGYSLALMRLDARRSNVVFHWASMAFAGGSAACALFGLALAENPLLTDEPVLGRTVLSSLSLAYLLPGLAALYLARASRDLRPAAFVTGLYVMAAILIFAWATLEVRHAFQGPVIGLFRWTSAPEHWCYSAVWLLLGIFYLSYGIWRDNLMARIASALLVLLATGKVFLVDLAHLTGPWRALSFIVLGIVLIGIGLVYQNLVFGRWRQPGAAPPGDGV